MVASNPVPVRRWWRGPVSCADVPLDGASADVERGLAVPAQTVETFVAARKDFRLGRAAPGGPHRPATDQEPSPISQGDDAMQSAQESPDPAETVRRERFGKLPKRIHPTEMVEERAATSADPAENTYSSDEWLVRYCL
ncbi:hypothetical protein [Streptomyces sp. NPDC005262]|uniref:hypothetical protein n=1 Tax=Streptomyces sp. NPDC005262 TaxID=3364710 RepID=UPI003688B037